MLFTVLIACEETEPVEGRVRVVEEPTLAWFAEAPLTPQLSVATDVPTRLEAHLVADGVDLRVRWPEVATDHAVPLIGGKPDRDVDVTLVLTAEDGATATTSTAYRTPALVDPFPEVDVLTADPSEVSPGYVLLSLETPDGLAWLAAVDLADGEVGWIYGGSLNFGDARVTERGTIFGLALGARELDIFGQQLGRFAGSGVLEPGDVLLPWPNLHHEVHPLPDGTFASITHRARAVDAYPISYEAPDLTYPATIADDAIVRFDDAGTNLGEWWLSERLDTRRIGFDSLNSTSGGFDWSHTNAVIPSMTPGGLIVSIRHQNAVVELGPDGDVRWILAAPTGWHAPFDDLLLRADGELTTSWHQHGPSLDADGNLIVLDNGNDGYDPYSEPPAVPEHTRVVAWTIDPQAMTARTAWTWTPPGPTLYSPALGNATAMPNGRVLAAVTFLDGEGDVLNADVGRGRKAIRLFEIDPTRSEPIGDVRLWLPVDAHPEGVKSYRGVPVGAMYPSDVEVSWTR